jgi:hypothetical protein
MHDYLELEYEDLIEDLYGPSEDELFEEYYSIKEENYSYSPDWSNQNLYVEYWDTE